MEILSTYLTHDIRVKGIFLSGGGAVLLLEEVVLHGQILQVHFGDHEMLVIVSPEWSIMPDILGMLHQLLLNGQPEIQRLCVYSNYSGKKSS